MSNNDKVKFFVPPAFIKKDWQPIPMLYSLWGGFPTDRTPYLKELYKNYHYNTNFFKLVDSAEEADFVLVPYRYNYIKKKAPLFFKEFVKFAQNLKKPLFVDGTGDIEYTIDIPNVYVLKTVGYKSLGVPKNDIHIPVPADDLLERFYDGNLYLREKKDIPSLSFAGWAKLSLKRRIKRYIKEAPYRIIGLIDDRYQAHKQGVFFRLKALKYLKKTKDLKQDFLIRSSYSGHIATSEKDTNELRKEFVENMYENDYALCIRGDSNISTRFYEALSLGRIPLEIDTDCVYPFEDEIDYESFCVFVDFRDIESAGKILREFHSNITNEKFQEMQKKAREVYVNYIRVDKFSEHLMRRLKKIAGEYY